MSNADSATNMLWLINQATAGDLSMSGGGAKPAAPAAAGDKKADAAGEEKKEGVLSAGSGASFNNFKIDMNA
jgi:hypothetical protein